MLQPNDKPGSYATVTMKPGVAILPIDRDRIVYLTRQFRYALGQESLEVVCGAVEEDEPAMDTAQREVQEELGIKADEWRDLGCFQMDTSIVRCPVYLFLATQLTFVETNREGTKTIETVKVPFNEAVQMVMDSVIIHSPSCVLILKADRALRGLK